MNAIVLTHYRLPLVRLAAHFVWNDALYRARGVRVLVVSDVERPVPDYAECLVWRGPELNPFALARTSNWGIRTAIARGAERVVKTDPDILFPMAALDLALSAEPGEGYALRYRMADSAEQAESDPEACLIWPSTAGTLCLAAADWNWLCGYNELFAGYGPEDGEILERAHRLGIRITRDRSCPVFHVAHEAGTPQQSHQRRDEWNRHTINPQNFDVNRRALRAGWSDPNWGSGL